MIELKREVKLLGCPMCGEKPNVDTDYNGFLIVCANYYHCLLVHDNTFEQAAKAWNTRFNEDNKDGKN